MEPKGALRFDGHEADCSLCWSGKALEVIESHIGRIKKDDTVYLEVGVEGYDIINLINIARANNMALCLKKDYDCDEWSITVLRIWDGAFETVFWSPGA